MACNPSFRKFRKGQRVLFHRQGSGQVEGEVLSVDGSMVTIYQGGRTFDRHRTKVFHVKQANPSKRSIRKRVSRSLSKYLKNFTGTIKRNPDGSVVIVGTGPKPKGARVVGQSLARVQAVARSERRYPQRTKKKK